MTKEELLGGCDLFLFDLDGTLYLADTPVAGAAEALARLREKGKRVWKQRRKDNHWFDCLCLCTAAAHSTWTPSLSRILEAVEEEEPAFAERKGA